MSENKRFATCQGDYQNVGAPPIDPVEPSHAVLLIPGLSTWPEVNNPENKLDFLE